MEYEKVTETIIGCAQRVYNKMGSGSLESIYENCLLIELCKTGLDTETKNTLQFIWKEES